MEDLDIASSPGLSATTLKPYLKRCGYDESRLAPNYRLDDETVPLAAFADRPWDARSACIAVVDSDGDSAGTAKRYWQMGAPVIFVCHPGGVDWWKPTVDGAESKCTVKPSRLKAFFERHESDLSPDRIYRAKTIGRFDTARQLDFVDVGLMPMVEQRVGEHLSNLVADVIKDMIRVLNRPKLGAADAKNVFKSAFWLLAARMLHDKGVERFLRIDLSDASQVFERVGNHYADAGSLPPNGPGWKAALREAADTIGGFAHLGNVSTEALAYLYENTLVPRDVRKELGIHSTPSYLVDYILWQLAPWIEDIPREQRYVCEPACGHGAFLIGTMRLLRLMLGDTDDTTRHKYLREHLRGIEIDSFALEIARLSLTLADIPNPNGWRVEQCDMFASDVLTREAKRARILVANPPYEKFKPSDRATYAKARAPVSSQSKAVELLARTLPHLADKAVFGVVVPQGVLHSKEATDVRKHLVTEFEISEICLFPDKVFQFSDAETAILLGRKKAGPIPTRAVIRYRRVREDGMKAFRESYAVGSDRTIAQLKLAQAPDQDLRVPELDEMWTYTKRYPTLATLADVVKGFDFKGRNLPRGAVTWQPRRREGLTAGYNSISRTLAIHDLPTLVWINLDPSAIESPRSGTTTGLPQVLLNYARVSRGPWRLKAVIDRDGHAVTSNFLTVRPHSPSVPLEYLWTLLNSPVANAYAFLHSPRRHTIAGTMRKMPVPSASPNDIENVVKAAKEYLELARQSGGFMRPEPSTNAIQQALLRMDAEVLRLYDLPPRLERELLDLFRGEERKGVGCDFRGYFPPDFTPCIPLHEYLSEDYRRSTAGEMHKRFRPARSPAVLSALSQATEAFGEE